MRIGTKGTIRTVTHTKAYRPSTICRARQPGPNIGNGFGIRRLRGTMSETAVAAMSTSSLNAGRYLMTKEAFRNLEIGAREWEPGIGHLVPKWDSKSAEATSWGFAPPAPRHVIWQVHNSNCLRYDEGSDAERHSRHRKLAVVACDRRKPRVRLRVGSPNRRASRP